MHSAAASWRAIFLSGICLALAFPYPDLHPLIWVALIPLLLHLRQATPWQCWWVGLGAGIVFRMGSLYWISHVMVLHGGMSWPVGGGIAVLLAIWMGLNTGAFCLLIPAAFRWGSGGALALAAAWVSLEYLQTLLPFGFPWSAAGYAAGRSPVLMQGADLAGVWGLSFVAVFVNAAIALRIVKGRRAFPAAAVAATMIVALGLYGSLRLSAAPPLEEAPSDTGLRVGVIQGNVEQSRVWNPSELLSILQEHVRLSLQAVEQGADLLIWAESSVPVRGGLEGDPGTKQMLSGLARQHGVSLVVGSPHFENDGGTWVVTNAAFMVSAAGGWEGRYDKVRLVPWGEYVPVSWLFRFVAPLVDAPAGFRHGAPDQELFSDVAAGAPPFAMAICYEIVFPNHVRRQVARGAEFLVTITNDAWFGVTSAPYQHFSMARLRAVENRRYLVRAANTGISGIVDPWGRVLQRSDINETALLLQTIEPRSDRSSYVVWGDLFVQLCVALSIVCAALAWRDARRQPIAPPLGAGTGREP